MEEKSAKYTSYVSGLRVWVSEIDAADAKLNSVPAAVDQVSRLVLDLANAYNTYPLSDSHRFATVKWIEKRKQCARKTGYCGQRNSIIPSISHSHPNRVTNSFKRTSMARRLSVIHAAQS